MTNLFVSNRRKRCKIYYKEFEFERRGVEMEWGDPSFLFIFITVSYQRNGGD